MSTALPQVDAAGFARVYERHHQALYRYCRSILRHEQDAQDALQSAMMRAFVALQTERRELELRPWLFRIAHNESINILRRRSHAGLLDEAVDEVTTLEDRVHDRETLRLLRHDLADLPERQRNALVLRELNGLGHEEIAAVLGTTPAAVKQAIFEGRSALLRCREGRDAACAEIQQILSDGDGRILRSRPVRAHLRACAGCREFRGALVRRPRDLAALLPPLPGGTALALLRGLFDGPAATVTAGGLTTGLAAKAAIVVAIAGSGSAVALQARGDAPRRVAPHAPAVTRPARTTKVVSFHPAAPHAVSQPAATARPHRAATLPRRPKHHAATHARPVRPVHATKHAAVAPPDAKLQPAPGPKPIPPGQAKKHAAPAAKPVPPGKAKKQAAPGAKPIPPGQAKKQKAGIPPGQAKKQAGDSAPPPGHAKKPPAGETVPPGQAKKQAASPPVDAGPPPEAPPAAVPPAAVDAGPDHPGHGHGHG
jgi:RNA polymerase sigma factor (sigma-70 family)